MNLNKPTMVEGLLDSSIIVMSSFSGKRSFHVTDPRLYTLQLSCWRMCILTDKSEKSFCNIYKQIINNNCATSKNCIVYMYIDLLISIYIYIYCSVQLFKFYWKYTKTCNNKRNWIELDPTFTQCWYYLKMEQNHAI